MAQGRMLNSKISLSEKVADLSLIGQLFYTWAISHCDDVGLLQGSARTLKAQIIPMVDVSIEDVQVVIDKILDCGLWVELQHDGKKYYRIGQFDENQKLRRDKFPYTVLPVKRTSTPQEFWEVLLQLVNDLEIKKNSKKSSLVAQSTLKNTDKKQSVQNCSVSSRTVAERKGNEMKRKEKKRINNSDKKFGNKKGLEKIGKLPLSRYKKKPSNGISHKWQEDAERVAKKLNITKPSPSWFKLFKNAYKDKKVGTLNTTYSAIADLNPKDPEKYFFKVFAAQGAT